jgi:hypothetical protein
VLQYISVGRWRLFAVVVAAACGGVLSLLRVSTSALSVGAVFGLLLGGGADIVMQSSAWLILEGDCSFPLRRLSRNNDRD